MHRQSGRNWRGKQRLGQHFLADSEVCRCIVEAAAIRPGEHTVEIGPGTGALTGYLASGTGPLTLIEPDENLADGLHRAYPGVEIIGGRGEDADYGALSGPLVIVSNLPYYASVQIYKRLTEHKKNISRMVLMFQKEVAERISAGPGGRHYGSLSVWSGYHWSIDAVIQVPPSAFRPPPKVFSTVLKFTPRTPPPPAENEEELFRLVRASFVQKRRMLLNNLKGIYSAESLETAFRSAGIEKNARAEVVSLEQFAKMLPLLEERAEPLEPHP